MTKHLLTIGTAATIAVLLSACTSSGYPTDTGTSSSHEYTSAMASSIPAISSAAMASSAATAPSGMVPSNTAVSISGFKFSPAAITVHAGTTVTWTNNDTSAHTVTGDNGAPGSQLLSQGQSFSYTFTTPGTYTYHCSIHPSMTGTVVVQ